MGRGHTAPHLAPCTHPSSPCCVLTFTPCAVWLATAWGSWQPSWWAAEAVPSLPGSVRTGPVPCRDPALCCCLHGPQLSKPHCQMPGTVSFLPGVGTGLGAACAGRTADTQRGQQVYSQLTAQGSIPSQVGMAGPRGLAGMKGWPGATGCPPPPHSAQGGLVQQDRVRWVAFSWPRPSVPTTPSAPGVPGSCAFPVREGAAGGPLTTSHWR